MAIPFCHSDSLHCKPPQKDFHVMVFRTHSEPAASGPVREKEFTNHTGAKMISYIVLRFTCLYKEFRTTMLAII